MRRVAMSSLQSKLHRVQKTRVFFKKAQPSGFFRGLGVGQAGKIGKIIQKLSNLKP